MVKPPPYMPDSVGPPYPDPARPTSGNRGYQPLQTNSQHTAASGAMKHNAPPPYTPGPGVGPPQGGFAEPGYSSGAPAYQPAPTPVVPVAASTIVVTGAPLMVLGPLPSTVQCRACNQVITTKVEFVTGQTGYLLAGLLCLIGCWCGCCLIPIYSKKYKDVHHYCPECKTYLGKYKK